MSESFLERLSKFTPDAGRLERDNLLFAAGQASARPNRGWRIAAILLASTQAMSLALYWPLLTTPTSGPTMASIPRSAHEESQAAALEPGDRGDLWSVRHNSVDSDTEDRTSESVTLVDSDPPLRAFAPPPASILN